MKKLLFLLVFIPLLSFGQETFDSFNKDNNEDGPKLIFKSYTDAEQTYFLAFYDDGRIMYQSPEYDYLEDRKFNNIFNSVEEIKILLTDMKTVSKKKETIIKEKYAIEKNAFGSVKLKIKDIPKTFFFTKYAMKLFQKALDKY